MKALIPDGLAPAVKDFLKYMIAERGASPNTVLAYRRDLADWEKWTKKRGLPLYPVRAEAQDEYLRHLMALGLVSSTRMRRAAALRSFSNYLIYDGYAEADDVKPRIPKRDKTLPQVMTEGEIERVLSGCDLPPAGREQTDADRAVGARDKLMIEMIYDCGLRASELCRLRLADLDFTEGLIRVTGKGGKTRIVPFVGALREKVKAYIDGAREFFLAVSRRTDRADKRDRGGVKPADALFLTVRGRLVPRSELWVIVRRRGKAAGVARERLHPHTLRHSFATHLHNRGMDIRTLQELLGHSTIATTEKYTHIDNVELRDIYDQFNPRA